ARAGARGHTCAGRGADVGIHWGRARFELGEPDVASPAMTSTISPDSGAALRRVLPRAARGGILVLGGVFAGGSVARRLGASGATIVNPTNFMLYTPLLPEAAAGSLEPRPATAPLRSTCPHCALLLR